jgi:hypothetical protein
MSQQNIYSIQLLNDLHNHFPDVLYNPDRFHNIQDLLQYIRLVADTSPYERGLIQYNNRTSNQIARNNILRQHTYPPPGPYIPPPPPVRTVFRNDAAPAQPQLYVSTVFEDIPQTNTTTTTNNLVNSIFNGIIGDLLGGVGSGGGGGGYVNLNAFLNERVPVYPTNEQIHAATTLHTAIQRQDDICAICQDDIETNQEMRRLNHCGHYFHRHCVDTWFQTNVHCPTCRHDIREQPVANPPQPPQENQPPPVPENHRRMNIRR